VTAVTDLYTYGFYLGWSPANLLECTGVSEVTSFFDGEFHVVIDNTGGEVYVASSLVGSVPGKTGSGDLASFTLDIKDTGNTTLALYGTELYNTTTSMPHSVINGTFYTTFPRARFSYLPDPREGYEYAGRPTVDEPVTFNASESYDPDDYYGDTTPGGIANYEWDFDYDGTTFDVDATGMIVNHTYTEPGQYPVNLTVTDDEGERWSLVYPTEGVKIFEHDIAVIDTTVRTPQVLVGETAEIDVTVVNLGSETEALNVTTYANMMPVNTTRFIWTEFRPPPSPPVRRTAIQAGENATATIRWDTTGFAPANYTIGVWIFLVHLEGTRWVLTPGIEPNQFNNGLVDGDVAIISTATHAINITRLEVGPRESETAPVDLELDDWSEIEVELTNRGNVAEHYNLTVTIYNETSVFEAETWENVTIGPGLTRTRKYSWLEATETTHEGYYNVTATVVLINATTGAALQNGNTNDTRTIPDFLIRLKPVASFDYSPISPDVGETVAFDAAESYAPGANGGTIVRYYWSFGDGAELYETANTTTHVYKVAATFTVTLTVTDDSGLSNQATHAIIASPTHDVAVTNVTLSQNVVETGDTLTANVTVSNLGHFSESVNVTLYYDGNAIATETKVLLVVEGHRAIQFTWDTTGFAGSYTIKARVHAVDGEIQTANNLYVDGTVVIGKASSTLTLEASPASLTVGETTTLEGALSPSHMDVEVTIWHRLSGAAWSTLTTVTTDASGLYTYEWTPTESGTYAIKASWEGDTLTQSQESEVATIFVQDVPQLDIFPYTTAALAVGLVAVIAYFVWVRKPKPASRRLVSK
jgi:PKD repeat protein